MLHSSADASPLAALLLACVPHGYAALVAPCDRGASTLSVLTSLPLRNTRASADSEAHFPDRPAPLRAGASRPRRNVYRASARKRGRAGARTCSTAEA